MKDNSPHDNWNDAENYDDGPGIDTMTEVDYSRNPRTKKRIDSFLDFTHSNAISDEEASDLFYDRE